MPFVGYQNRFNSGSIPKDVKELDCTIPGNLSEIFLNRIQIQQLRQGFPQFPRDVSHYGEVIGTHPIDPPKDLIHSKWARVKVRQDPPEFINCEIEKVPHNGLDGLFTSPSTLPTS